jgi:hypothetical protein
MNDNDSTGSILRSRRKTGYSHINNDLFDDQNLDWEHRGMLTTLLSKPDGWRIITSHLVSQTNNSGRDRVRRILRELEEIGYIVRTKHRGDDGQYFWTSEVFESLSLRDDNFTQSIPKLKPRKPPKSSSRDGSSRDGSSGDGSSGSLLITDLVTPELEINITNSLTLTADAESGELFPENSENAQEHSTSLERAKPQQTSFIDSNFISGEEKTPQPPARSTNPDKSPWGDKYDRQAANRERAAASSYFEIGLKNKRWKDRADFNKFKTYAKVWAHNRQEDAQLNPDRTKYGDGYINSILSRTASTQDENDKDLMCWRCWNQERSAPVFKQSIEPEPVVEIDEVERQQQIKKWTEILENRRREREAEAAAELAKDQAREEMLRNIAIPEWLRCAS